MLARQIIERAYNELLQPAGVQRPVYDKLGADIGASDTTITVTGRVNNIPDDTVLEIDSELLLVDTVSNTTITINERGWLESDATTHVAGTKVWIEPDVTRIQLMNALKAAIGMLYDHGLYIRATDTSLSYSSVQPVSLPTNAKDLLMVRVIWGGLEPIHLKPGVDFEILHDYIPPELQFFGGYDGASLRVTYTKDFDTSSLVEATDLDTIGVPSNLQPWLPLAVAGYVLMGREIPREQLEDLTRSMQATNVPPGSNLSVSRQLMNEFRTHVQAEVSRQRRSFPPIIEYVRT